MLFKKSYQIYISNALWVKCESIFPRVYVTEKRIVHRMSKENIVYVGSKPVMNYCLAVLTSLKAGDGTVTLKARGRAISTAVDVAEVTRNRFLEDLSIEEIQINTEELPSSEGGTRNVSSMAIVLKK
jgi:DNA-binding protein